MQQFSLCFGKVKKDCLKFIKSQETKADKFKNKERMINELNAELERFIDPNNRESATSKLTEILETEEGKVVEAFEKALNPDNKESQIHKVKETLEKKFTTEMSNHM